MNESVKTKYNYWLNKVSNKALSDEMHAMTEEQIVNAFYKDLEFGTGGMRGTMGAGTNCLNIYTIARATQGLANYMKAHNLHSAAITYDTRINSRLFSRHAAAVLATNGIKVHIVGAVTVHIAKVPIAFIARTAVPIIRAVAVTFAVGIDGADVVAVFVILPCHNNLPKILFACGQQNNGRVLCGKTPF